MAASGSDLAASLLSSTGLILSQYDSDDDGVHFSLNRLSFTQPLPSVRARGGLGGYDDGEDADDEGNDSFGHRLSFNRAKFRSSPRSKSARPVMRMTPKGRPTRKLLEELPHPPEGPAMGAEAGVEGRARGGSDASQSAREVILDLLPGAELAADDIVALSRGNSMIVTPRDKPESLAETRAVKGAHRSGLPRPESRSSRPPSRPSYSRGSMSRPMSRMSQKSNRSSKKSSSYERPASATLSDLMLSDTYTDTSRSTPPPIRDAGLIGMRKYKPGVGGRSGSAQASQLEPWRTKLNEREEAEMLEEIQNDLRKRVRTLAVKFDQLQMRAVEGEGEIVTQKSTLRSLKKMVSLLRVRPSPNPNHTQIEGVRSRNQDASHATCSIPVMKTMNREEREKLRSTQNIACCFPDARSILTRPQCLTRHKPSHPSCPSSLLLLFLTLMPSASQGSARGGEASGPRKAACRQNHTGAQGPLLPRQARGGVLAHAQADGQASLAREEGRPGR